MLSVSCKLVSVLIFCVKSDSDKSKLYVNTSTNLPGPIDNKLTNRRSNSKMNIVLQ